MKLTVRYLLCLLIALPMEVRAQQPILPSTEQFMNIIATCGAGSSLSREGNFQSNARDIYETERTQGKSLVDILAHIFDKLPENQRLEAFKIYSECVRTTVSGQITLAQPEKQQGWLQYANEPTPANGCDRWSSSIPKDRIMLVIGDNGYWLEPASPTGKSIAVLIGNCALLSIGAGDNGAVIDADIYGVDGETLGSIRHNGWKLANTKRLNIQTMGDLSGVVVHDTKGTELLYVRYYNNKTFKIRGQFTCPFPSLNTVKITEKEILYPRMMVHLSSNCAGNAAVGFSFH